MQRHGLKQVRLAIDLDFSCWQVVTLLRQLGHERRQADECFNGNAGQLGGHTRGLFRVQATQALRSAVGQHDFAVGVQRKDRIRLGG